MSSGRRQRGRDAGLLEFLQTLAPHRCREGLLGIGHEGVTMGRIDHPMQKAVQAIGLDDLGRTTRLLMDRTVFDFAGD